MTENNTEIYLDESYTNFKKAFDNGVFSMDCDKYINEIKTNTRVRQFRNVRSEALVQDTNKLIEVIMDNQVRRTRVVEIKQLVQANYNKLTYRIESMSNFLQVKYNKTLRAYSSTQAERATYVKELFSFADDILLDMKNLILFCDSSINDIDQTSWSLKSIIDCLKILDEVRRNNVWFYVQF